MKLDKEAYKKYQAPTSLFLGYIIGSVACVCGLDYLRRLMMNFDFELSIFNDVLRIALFLIAYVVVGLLLFWGFTLIFGYRSKKIYRGIGFYRFINVVTIICPLGAVATVIVSIALNFSINFHTFFNMVALVGEVLFPCFIRVSCYHKLYLRKCPSCGLINTMSYHSETEEQIGTRVDLYDDGIIHYKPTAYGYSERKKTTKMKCSVCGGFDHDYSTYDKRI